MTDYELIELVARADSPMLCSPPFVEAMERHGLPDWRHRYVTEAASDCRAWAREWMESHG